MKFKNTKVANCTTSEASEHLKLSTYYLTAHGSAFFNGHIPKSFWAHLVTFFFFSLVISFWKFYLTFSSSFCIDTFNTSKLFLKFSYQALLSLPLITDLGPITQQLMQIFSLMSLKYDCHWSSEVLAYILQEPLFLHYEGTGRSITDFYGISNESFLFVDYSH